MVCVCVCGLKIMVSVVVSFLKTLKNDGFGSKRLMTM